MHYGNGDKPNSFLSLDLNVPRVPAALVFAEFVPETESSNGEATKQSPRHLTPDVNNAVLQ